MRGVRGQVYKFTAGWRWDILEGVRPIEITRLRFTLKAALAQLSEPYTIEAPVAPPAPTE